jgi:PAS domain S-box-containing protein
LQVADHSFVGLLEGAPDAMVCVDRSGRIALVNGQAERLFGYGRAELVDQPVEMLVPEAARAGHPAQRGHYMGDPEPRPMSARMELSGRRRDGSTFPAEISLSGIDTDDGLLVIAAVRDVTEQLELRAARERLKNQAERDKLEQQLQQSQRLESLGQLAGGVAHDFNNLLAVITNYAEFVGEEVAKDAAQADWQSVRHDVTQIQLAAGRAADLTRQLLAFARRDVVQPRPLNLNEVIASVEQLLIRTLGEHVELKTKLAPGLCAVLTDPGQIEQVLVNLAVNARDAMPAGGTLMVETTTADIDASHAASRVGLPPGQYACMKIGDTGTGMPREVIDRAFEPFYTTKPKGEGTGLGLATVYGIVTRAGGYVQIYSEPGVGTTFTILLPATGQEVQMEPTAEQKPAKGAGETVLIVEDEPAMREVTHRILSRADYNVIAAANGREAIEIVTNYPGDIDVLLTDVIMPQMPGKEAAERIRALRPGIKVLFMSGYTQGLLDTQGVVEVGINLLEKPFTEASLLIRLGQLIAGPGGPRLVRSGFRRHQLRDLRGVKRRPLAQVVAADEELDRPGIIKRLAHPANPGRIGADDASRGGELARGRVVSQHHARRRAQHVPRLLTPDRLGERGVHGHRMGGDHGHPDARRRHRQVGQAEDLARLVPHLQLL